MSIQRRSISTEAPEVSAYMLATRGPLAELAFRRRKRAESILADQPVVGRYSNASSNLLSSGSYNGDPFITSAHADEVLLQVSCDDPDLECTLQQKEGSDWVDLAVLEPSVRKNLKSYIQAGAELRIKIAADASATCTSVAVTLRQDNRHKPSLSSTPMRGDN